MTSLADSLQSTGLVPPMRGDIPMPDDAPPAKDTVTPSKPETKKTESSMVAEGNASISEDIKKMEENKPPALPQFKEAPKFETKDESGQGYVAAVGLLGAIGSMFTRRPMINSMNSAAAVLESMKRGDLESYKQNFEKWKIDNENIKALSDYQQAIYEDIFKKDKVSLDTKLGMLQAQAAAFKDDAMMEHIKNGDMISAKQLKLDREKMQQDWDMKRGEREKSGLENQIKLEQFDTAKEDLQSGKITKEEYLHKLENIVNPSVAAAEARGEAAANKEKDKLKPELIPKTEGFGFTTSVTKASSEADKSVDVEARKKERNVPIYADRIMSELDNVVPQLDKFPTGASSGVRQYAMKAANLVSFNQLFPTVATAGDLIDKNLYNVILDYTNLVQNTGMRGSNLQLQTNIRGKPGPELMRTANKSIVDELRGNTTDVKLRFEASNLFRQANPLGVADERAGALYEALKAKHPLMTPKTDKQGNVLVQFHPENAKKIRELLPKAIAHPEEYSMGEDTPPVPDAKKAEDGNWYVPDPNRPGKYLKVE